MPNMRFLSFNIHGGRGRDGKSDFLRITELMDRFHIDIGIFQEVETRASKGGSAKDILELSGSTRPYICVGPSLIEGELWYGNLIVSRYPIIEGLVHNLETRSVYEPRNAVDALIKTPLGDMRIVGTHLSLSPFERFSEAHRLLRLMAAVAKEEPAPILLAGDINEWLWNSPLLRFLDKKMTPIRVKPTFPAWLPLLRLDRVWVDAPAFHATAHRLANPEIRFISDHLPILIEISRRVEESAKK